MDYKLFRLLAQQDWDKA